MSVIPKVIMCDGGFCGNTVFHRKPEELKETSWSAFIPEGTDHSSDHEKSLRHICGYCKFRIFSKFIKEKEGKSK